MLKAAVWLAVLIGGEYGQRVTAVVEGGSAAGFNHSASAAAR
jgi:hypothetical protein